MSESVLFPGSSVGSSTGASSGPIGRFGDFPLSRTRFSVRFSRHARVSRFTGSAWRGLIGWELAKLVCPFDRRPKCAECTIRDHCPHFLLFEQRPQRHAHLGSPRGFALKPSEPDPEGGAELELTLFGSCTRLLPVLTLSLFNGAKTGLGANRDRYEIVEIAEMLPGGERRVLPTAPAAADGSSGPRPLGEWLRAAPAGNGNLRARLLTPVRTRKDGHYMGEMDWPGFFGALARRLQALHCQYGAGEPMERAEWLAARDRFAAESETIEADLRWLDLSRYSNRQKTKMQIGGLIGDVRIPGPSDWMRDWWRAAELVHVGKGAAMGLGVVAVE